MKRRTGTMSHRARSRLPPGQRTYKIQVTHSDQKGEYEGASTVSATARMARTQFVPYVGPKATVAVVHFDRYGDRTIVDKYVQRTIVDEYPE